MVDFVGDLVDLVGELVDLDGDVVAVLLLSCHDKDSRFRVGGTVCRDDRDHI